MGTVLEWFDTSRLLKREKLVISIYLKKLPELVFAVSQSRYYIFGKYFVVYANHHRGRMVLEMATRCKLEEIGEDRIEEIVISRIEETGLPTKGSCGSPLFRT